VLAAPAVEVQIVRSAMTLDQAPATPAPLSERHTDDFLKGDASHDQHKRDHTQLGVGRRLLPSWRQTPTRQSITDFVVAVTDPKSPDYVEEPERVAVFDNDGTLWAEPPLYAQLAFALDRAAQLGHPTSLDDLHSGGMDPLKELIALTHSGVTTEEFDDLCRSRLSSARHPRLDLPYPKTETRPLEAAPTRSRRPPPNATGPRSTWPPTGPRTTRRAPKHSGAGWVDVAAPTVSAGSCYHPKANVAGGGVRLIRAPGVHSVTPAVALVAQVRTATHHPRRPRRRTGRIDGGPAVVRE